MSRGRKLLLLVPVVVAFLAVSALLARVFSADSAERSAITGLVEAEARGDAQGMLQRLTGCREQPACSIGVQADARALRREGQVSIIQLQPSSGFSLGSTHGIARVAWKTMSSLPIVQCVRVRRRGNALQGLRVELLAVSPRIPGTRDCPAHLRG